MFCTFFNNGIKSLEPSLTKHIHGNVVNYKDTLKKSLEYKGIPLTNLQPQTKTETKWWCLEVTSYKRRITCQWIIFYNELKNCM